MSRNVQAFAIGQRVLVRADEHWCRAVVTDYWQAAGGEWLRLDGRESGTWTCFRATADSPWRPMGDLIDRLLVRPDPAAPLLLALTEEEAAQTDAALFARYRKWAGTDPGDNRHVPVDLEVVRRAFLRLRALGAK